jgi:hypothetical protein
VSDFDDMMNNREIHYELDTPQKVIGYLRFCMGRTAHAGLKPMDCKILVDHFDQLTARNVILAQALSEVPD